MPQGVGPWAELVDGLPPVPAYPPLCCCFLPRGFSNGQKYFGFLRILTVENLIASATSCWHQLELVFIRGSRKFEARHFLFTFAV